MRSSIKTSVLTAIVVFLSVNAAFAQYSGKVNKDEAAKRIQRPKSETILAGRRKILCPEYFTLNSQQQVNEPFGWLEPNPTPQKSEISREVGNGLIKLQDSVNLPKCDGPIDYAAIEQEYAKAGSLTSQPQETAASRAEGSFVLPNIKTMQTPVIDPKNPSAYIIDNDGTVNYRPDLRTTVCECGTPIPSSSCLQQRAGVGIYGSRYSMPAMRSTVAVPANIMRGR